MTVCAQLNSNLKVQYSSTFTLREFHYIRKFVRSAVLRLSICARLSKIIWIWPTAHISCLAMVSIASAWLHCWSICSADFVAWACLFSMKFKSHSMWRQVLDIGHGSVKRPLTVTAREQWGECPCSICMSWYERLLAVSCGQYSLAYSASNIYRLAPWAAAYGQYSLPYSASNIYRWFASQTWLACTLLIRAIMLQW